MDWFTSDLHLGHLSVIKHRTEFKSLEEMRNTICKNFECVRKGDRLFLLGDLGWSVEEVRSFIERFTSKGVHVFWIRGNHDTDELWKLSIPDNQKSFLHKCDSMKVRATTEYSGLFLSHYPMLIWDKSHYNGCHLYGHSHKDTSDVPYTLTIMKGKCLNVNVELHDYKPWSRDEVQEYMDKTHCNIDYYLCKGTDRQKSITLKFLNRLQKRLERYYRKMEKEVDWLKNQSVVPLEED